MRQQELWLEQEVEGPYHPSLSSAPRVGWRPCCGPPGLRLPDRRPSYYLRHGACEHTVLPRYPLLLAANARDQLLSCWCTALPRDYDPALAQGGDGQHVELPASLLMRTI